MTACGGRAILPPARAGGLSRILVSVTDKNETVEAEGMVVQCNQPSPGADERRVVAFAVTPRSNDVDAAIAGAQFFADPDEPLPRTVERLLQKDYGRLSDAVRAMFAFLLYLMSEHPLLGSVKPPAMPDLDRIRNPAKRRKAEERARKWSRMGYVYVGGERDLEGTGEAGAAAAPQWKLDRQVWVRGHFRNQAWGPGHTLRKLQWIKPHRRGPDMAESVRVSAQNVQPAKPRAEQR